LQQLAAILNCNISKFSSNQFKRLGKKKQMRLATNTFLEKMIVGKYILCKKLLEKESLLGFPAALVVRL